MAYADLIEPADKTKPHFDAREANHKRADLTVLGSRNNNSVASDLNLERKQCAASAWPSGAFTAIRFVKGAVGPTDQKPAVLIEELVRPPIKRCTGMDAIVDIGVVAPVEVHHKAFDKPLAPENVKFRGAAGRDFANRCGPHTVVSHCIISNPGWLHRENRIGVSATLVGLGKCARATFNLDL